ncbi:hypothetical protein SHIRM173S_06830 [Streptomyces hirsutus]
MFFLIAFAVTLVLRDGRRVPARGRCRRAADAGEPAGGEWLKATVGISLYVALLGTLALAVGSTVRHSCAVPAPLATGERTGISRFALLVEGSGDLAATEENVRRLGSEVIPRLADRP